MGIMNLEKVNSIKRENVQRGLDYLVAMNAPAPVIYGVILFGSSVTADCREDSDIDICLISDSDASNPAYFAVRSRLADVMDEPCDIFRYNRLPAKLKREVDAKGVKVYEYEPH